MAVILFLNVKGGVAKTTTAVAVAECLAVRAAQQGRKVLMIDAARPRGKAIGDADILIAATALVHGRAVVTNDEDHFRRVPGLAVIN